jgi:guanylate cyclase
MYEAGRLAHVKERLLDVGSYVGETLLERGRRRVIVGVLWLSIVGLALATVGSVGPWVTVLNALKALSHIGALVALALAPRLIGPILHTAFAIDLMADVTISILYGGLSPSGLQVMWSLIAVLGVLVALTVRAALVWSVIFAAAVLFVAASPSWVDARYELPNPEFNGAATIIGMTAFVVLALTYFVRQRDRFQRESDDLLQNILPEEIAARLKAGDQMIADHFDDVTVLFLDVVGFTPMSAAMKPTELVSLLNDIFTDLDQLVEEIGLEKIKTIGDEYMVAAGVPTPRADHAHATADLALRIRDLLATHEYASHRIVARIGINSGPVVAGIIGRRKFSYDLWGDVVNTASRMESHGQPGAIQISAATHERIRDAYYCELRGTIDVKGKGPLETWFLQGRRSDLPAT